MNHCEKFKSLLEYFVSHLEWLQNGDPSHPGYAKYIKPIPEFRKSGYGYKGDSIQNQIKNWEDYDFNIITINIYGANPRSKGCYLCWLGTWLNVRPQWGDNHVIGLYLSRQECSAAEPETTKSVESLGLFDGQKPNSNLKSFFNNFVCMYKNISEKALKLKQILDKNYNIILTGAPGTGKTFLSKEIARLVGASSENGRLGFVQFHPSYDYTDFVEGLRPVQDEKEAISFKRKDGIFMDFCRRALKTWNDAGYNDDTDDGEIQEEHKYIFIIDEINRGELSKIFGELFFSIDPGYRGKEGKVTTQYHNLWKDKDEKDILFDDDTKFYIPKNVYIIGTMNDIDRSVESMDFAMRRRFTFKDVTAKDSEIIIKSVEKLDEQLRDDLINRMEYLNEAIGNEESLGTAYQLGGAYFKKIENCLEDSDPCQKLWDNYLSNILKEYLRGMGKTQIAEKMQKFAQAFQAKYQG